MGTLSPTRLPTGISLLLPFPGEGAPGLCIPLGAAGVLLGASPQHSPGWGGGSRARRFLNKKEADPHIPVSASCWD